MKLVYLSLVIALAAAISLTGCGKDDSTTTNPNGNVITGAPAVPVPPVNLPNGTVPVGCYTTNLSTCAPCPYGFTSNGQYCTPTTTGGGGTYGCPAGTFYNGYNCQQIGYYTCPAGTTWNWTFYACTYGYGVYPPSGYTSNCKYKSYAGGSLWLYVCY